jgi:hypothetical protein
MTNQAPIDDFKPIMDLTKDLLKSYTKDNLNGDNNSVNLVFDLFDKFIDTGKTTSKSNDPKKTTIKPEKQRDMPPMGPEITNLMNMFIPKATQSSNVTVTKYINHKSPLKLINDLYDVFWYTNHFSKLENIYTKDALLGFVSGPDEDVHWNVTSAKKIVQIFENIWAPTIKINDTKVLKFEFNIDEDNETEIHCTIKYNIFQTQLENLSMTWIKFNIHASDKIILTKSDTGLQIQSHTIFQDKKEMIESVGSY